MTGRPNMGRAPVSQTLADWVALTDRIRREYRRRERQAPGSGDTWLAGRLEVLSRVEAEDSASLIAQSLHSERTGMFDRPVAGDGRAHARRRAGRFLSTIRTGGEGTR